MSKTINVSMTDLSVNENLEDRDERLNISDESPLHSSPAVNNSSIESVKKALTRKRAKKNKIYSKKTEKYASKTKKETLNGDKKDNKQDISERIKNTLPWDPWDDKMRYIMSDGISTLPWGHYKIPELLEKEKPTIGMKYRRDLYIKK